MLRRLAAAAPLSLAVLLSLAGLAACGEEKPPAPAAAQAAAARPPQPLEAGIPVEVQALKPRNFTLQRTYIGDIQPFQRVRIYSETEGFAEKVYVEEGDAVQEKARVADVSTTRTRAQRDLAQVNARLAKAEYKRHASLRKQAVISASQLDQVKAQRDTAVLNLKVAEINYQASLIRSPIAGQISKRLIEPGEFVNKGNQVAEVLQLRQVKAVFPVPERDVRFFSPGDVVRLTFDALPKTQLRGRVQRVALESGQQERSYQVEAQVDNAKARLRAGMLVRVQSTLQRFKAQILIPRHAVLERAGRRIAFIMRGEHAVEKTVVTGVSWKTEVQIVEGLAPGDLLIITGHQRLTSGDRVIVSNPPALQSQHANPPAPPAKTGS